MFYYYHIIIKKNILQYYSK